MSKPRLLDLFCGAGGAAVGYARAGFEVVGVDVVRQPRYPFPFIQDDAGAVLAELPLWTERYCFDAIHASPPCQAFTSLRSMPGTRNSPDLLTPTRTLLEASGLPWVIENVPGAPMRPDIVLCGSMFGLRVRRHRWFEFSQPTLALVQPCIHAEAPVGVYGHPGNRSSAAIHRNSAAPPSHRRHQRVDWWEAMGIDWMNDRELSQAIPPAYTEWIGRQLLAHLERAA